MFKSLISIIVACLFIPGCFNESNESIKSGPPECSEALVQDLIEQITDTELKKQFCEEVFADLVRNEEKVIKGGELTKDDKFPEELMQTNWGYSDLLPYAGGEFGYVDYILRKTEERLANTPYVIRSIRTTSNNWPLRICECAAELKLEAGASLSITYTAQYTDDGSEIVVEVFGL